MCQLAPPVVGAPDAAALWVGRRRRLPGLRSLATPLARGLLGRGHLDLRVHHVGCRARGSQADTAENALGQTATLQPLPALAPVGTLPDAAARATSVHAPRRAPPLVHRSVERIAVGRIDDDVGGAGVLVDEQHLAPALAAVVGLEDAALRVGAEQMSGSRHPDHVIVVRVDDDAGDRLRFLEANAFEALSGVGRLIDAVAVRRALTVVGLPRADPNDIRVALADREIANGGYRVGVEDWLPGGSVVRRLPHAPGRKPHIDGPRIGLQCLDIVDATAHRCRADRPENERTQQRVVRLVDRGWRRLSGLLAGTLRDDRNGHQRQTQNERKCSQEGGCPHDGPPRREAAGLPDGRCFRSYEPGQKNPEPDPTIRFVWARFSCVARASGKSAGHPRFQYPVELDGLVERSAS